MEEDDIVAAMGLLLVVFITCVRKKELEFYYRAL